MPPKSPDHPEESSDAPYPNSPRHKHGEFIESDLWDLDEPLESTPPPPKKPKKSSIPGGPSSAPATPSQAPNETHPETPPTGSEPEGAPPPDEISERETKDMGRPEARPESDDADAVAKPESKEPATAPAPSDKTSSTTKEAEAESPPTGRRPLKTIEWVSLIAIAVFVLGGLGFFIKVFLDQIPTHENRVEMPDFPIKGERVTVENAINFWREPIRSGPNRDTVRSTTKLIPVAEITIQGGGDGAMRIFFRDADGSLVGDSVTRAFSGGRFTDTRKPKIQIAATAGFDELAQYAAYQTGETKPWIIEVYEGPALRAPLESFHLLFKMPISTERR